jgi:hypothetical protein
MARRNIHKSKRLKSHKPAVPSKPVVQTAAASPSITATAPVKTAPVKATVAQEAASVRFAALPYELRRIALFSAFVVVLLIVLWFFLK